MRNLKKMTVMHFTDYPHGMMADTMKRDAIERANNQRFEYRYVDMPLMFRRKDIVHVIGTELYGIADGPINDKDELLYRNCAKNGDYSDWQVTVNLIYDGKKFLSVFSHDHIAPADLEYAEFENGDLRKGMLEYMVKTLYESSWLGGGSYKYFSEGGLMYGFRKKNICFGRTE